MKVGDLKVRDLRLLRKLGAFVVKPIGPYIEVKSGSGVSLFWEVDPKVLRQAQSK